MNWWVSVSNIGVIDSMSSMDKRRVRLTNRMIFIGWLLTLPYFILFLSFESKLPLLCVAILNLCTISLFILCKSQKHRLAAILMTLIASAYLLSIAFIIDSGTGHFFLIPISLFGFALLEKPLEGVILFIICCLTFFTAHFSQFIFDPIIPANKNVNNLIFIVNLSLIFLGTLYFFLQLKSTNSLYEKNLMKQTQQLELQHDQLVTTHEEIQDSIRYAKRIQNAILPANSFLKESLPEHFVMYLPKDIVAGDFYWLEKHKEELFIAVADCTGHGVPGALVSVVCHNALNRTIRELSILEPAQILDKTRDLVIDAFEQSEENVKDGMDIALCKLDNLKLTYAGANNPLWIIRNNEMIELKANKQPIGKFAASSNFIQQEFDLRSGDCVYLFSDGYADQFGGAKGKKFKTPSLKRLLLDIHQNPMTVQNKLLKEKFEAWKGRFEQIDDVCILGFRV